MKNYQHKNCHSNIEFDVLKYHFLEKTILTFVWNHKDPDGQNNFDKRTQSWRHHTS